MMGVLVVLNGGGWEWGLVEESCCAGGEEFGLKEYGGEWGGVGWGGVGWGDHGGGWDGISGMGFLCVLDSWN
jgi:hypothetical protein